VAKRKGNKVIVLYEIEAVIKWEVNLKNSAGETVSTAKVCLYELFSLSLYTHTLHTHTQQKCRGDLFRRQGVSI
jgi:hypothetical protein